MSFDLASHRQTPWDGDRSNVSPTEVNGISFGIRSSILQSRCDWILLANVATVLAQMVSRKEGSLGCVHPGGRPSFRMLFILASPPARAACPFKTWMAPNTCTFLTPF